MPRTNLAVRVAGSVFGIAGEMRRLPAYFDNPVYVYVEKMTWKRTREVHSNFFALHNLLARKCTGTLPQVNYFMLSMAIIL